MRPKILAIRVVRCTGEVEEVLETKGPKTAIKEAKRKGYDLTWRCGSCYDNRYRLQYQIVDPEDGTANWTEWLD